MTPFRLKKEDKISLKKFVRSGAAGHEIIRGITLIFRDKGLSRADVADALDITPRTVTNTCSNYENLGLERALKDDPRPGGPRIFDDRVKANIVAMVCSDPPEGFDRWTLDLIRTVAQDKGIVGPISKETIRLILKEHDLKPWQQRMWCIPDLNEEYIASMEDVLDVYERGDSEECPLICLDEKPVFLFGDSRPAELMEPGSTKKVDYEYQRKGMANVFFALEPFAGKYVAKVTEDRKGKTFANFLRCLSEKYHRAKKITLVMDNLNIHNKSSLVKAYGEEEAGRLWNRFEVHYTPKHGSWLNMAEIGIGMYSRQCLGRTRIPSIKDLRKKTNSWQSYINSKGLPIGWFFTKEDARIKMGYG